MMYNPWQMWREWFDKALQYLLGRIRKYLRESTEVEWREFQQRFRRILKPALPSWANPVHIKQKRRERKRARIAAAEAAADKRLSAVLSAKVPRPAGVRQQELTLKDLYRSVKPPSLEWLAFAASNRLSTSGWQRVFRVKSPKTPAFYKDYSSLEAIPAELFDEKSQQLFEVDPSFVTVVLKSN